MGTESKPRKGKRPKNLNDVLAELRGGVRWRDRIVHWHEVPARPGRTEPWPERLDPRLLEVFQSKGVEEPYAHQAEAIRLALAGKDVLVATPTASGKTVCYTAPVIQRLLETDGRSRALFLYPTKALSQDQTAGLTALVEAIGEDWHAYTYDGDTPPSVRRTLRDRGHMILTNPHMLHQGILPNHPKWSELFRELEFVVVDEVHSLSGVLGSSVSNVLRRLLRIARHYGANPRFLASSATLRDPGGHARRLFGREVEVVSEDASPAGKRTFAVHNPPIVNAVAGLRANALEEARELASAVCGPQHQVIFFCGRRTAVEVLTRYLKEGAAELGLKPSEIMGYRGGYLPDLRRKIEGGLRDGTIKVVVSTNALELGVDIGALDVAVLVGYPGSQASFWQRAGRVGRRGSPSLVVQIARSEPTDQYLVHHPQYLFEAPRERLGVDADHLVILSEQLKCAAFELPFRGEADGGDLEGEPDYADGELAAEILDYLAEESGFLHRRAGTWFWVADAYPAQDVSLDGGELDNVLILELGTEKAIGETDRENAITTCHEGAIYQVQGVTWRVERFDHKNRRAYVVPVESDYFTDAQTDTEVRVLRLETCEQRGRELWKVAEPFQPGASGTADAQLPALPQSGEDYSVWRGEVHVTTVATLYKKIRFYTRENVGAGEIHLPPEELDTEAFVMTLSEASAAELGLAGGDRAASWRAVGDLLRRVAPLFVRCSPSDLGLSSQVRSSFFGRPALFLYDRVQGGVGLSELLHEAHRELFSAALDVVNRCDCVEGCPACVGPRAEVGPMGKDTAKRLLTHLAGGPAPVSVEVEELEEPAIDAVEPADLRKEGHSPRGARVPE